MTERKIKAVELLKNLNIPTVRLMVALAAFAGVQGTVLVAKSFGVPNEPRPLGRAISDFPMEIGGFTGEDIEADPRVFQFLGTETSINRAYVNEQGRTVAAHCAAWEGGTEWAPHPPEGCYTTAGWTMTDSKITELPETGARVAIQSYERQGERIRVMYWYRMGEVTYLNRNEARDARRKFWGAGQWPPVVKVLLQAQLVGDDPPDELLSEFGVHMDEWARQL